MYKSQEKLLKILKEIGEKKPDDVHIVKYAHDLEPRKALLVRVINLNYMMFFGGWHYWKDQGFWSEAKETISDLGKLYEFSKWEPFDKIASIIPVAVKLLNAEPKTDSDKYDEWTDEMNDTDDKCTDLLLDDEERFYDVILEYYNEQKIVKTS